MSEKSPHRDSDAAMLEVHGVKIEIVRRGSGRPILFFHPEMGPDLSWPVFDLLAKQGELIAPSAPGFGRSDLPRHVSTVEDLSFIYLDLLEALDLRDAVVIGASLGAWLAASIAVKSCARIGALVLAGPYGVKFGAPDEANIVDMFMLSREDFDALAYVDPAVAQRDLKAMDHDTLTMLARNWDAAALFGWLPYMHDPKLRHRLHRISAPTLLLSGAQDRVLAEDYVRNFAEAIPGARHELIEGAGHYPHIEQPELFARRVAAFVGGIGVVDPTPPLEAIFP